MAHGKSLELQKLRPKLRLWANPGKITATKEYWDRVRNINGWDHISPRLGLDEANPTKA